MLQRQTRIDDRRQNLRQRGSSGEAGQRPKRLTLLLLEKHGGRGVRDGTEKFEQVLETVREVSELGMEVCVTLGQIGSTEARKLKAAGVSIQ